LPTNAPALISREFASEQGIKYFYDITDRANFKARLQGVCHIAITGAFGQFATGINTDAGFIMGTGKLD